MREGKVQWLSPKGYAFVRLLCGQKVYVPKHLAQDLEEGHDVMVKTAQGAVGPVAEELVKKTS